MDLKTGCMVGTLILAISSIILAAGATLYKIDSTNIQIQELKKESVTKEELALRESKIEQKLDIYIEQNAKEHTAIVKQLDHISDKLDTLIDTTKPYLSMFKLVEKANEPNLSK